MLQKFSWFQLLFAITLASTYDHRCLPYPIDSVCILDYISYRPGDLVTFPTGYQEYHIQQPRSLKESGSKVTTFDEALYKAMHQPSRVEMEIVQLTNVILPPELVLGNFARNLVRSVSVSSGKNYRIAYLDLASNSLTDIGFVSSLVNLEMLHLGSNNIRSIPGSALRPLTKLRYLYLSGNHFTTIPWKDLPCNLIHLDSYLGVVETVDFSNVNLPSLEYLNLRNNEFSAINVTALVQAALNLKDVYLYNDKIDEFRMNDIKVELTAKNISFVEEYEDRSCFYDDRHEFVGGKCVLLKDLPVGAGKAVALSSVALGVATLLVYLAYLVFSLRITNL
ncbi:hypothetical protein RP20_CCG012331 [Aedes albopictus]|nr:hypothetical protein RP20_CCG012331 [Aedes albopictus]